MNFLKAKDWAIPYSSIDNIRVRPYTITSYGEAPVTRYYIAVRSLNGCEFSYENFSTEEKAQEAFEKLMNEIHWISTGSCPTFSTAQ